jgi:predicted MFS family arabinose efflux permease
VGRDRIWSHDLGAALAGLFLLFVTTTMLVPVLPAVASRTGGSGAAGLATAGFYFPAVVTQLGMPSAMRRLRARTLLLAAFVLLAAPCIAYAAASHSLAVILVATVVRGVGFGIATVAAITMVAQLAPPGRRGTVIGWAGLAAGIPPVFAPAAGVYILHSSGAWTVFLLAGAVGLAGAAVSLMLSERPPLPGAGRARLLEAITSSALVWPFSWFLLVSLTRGAVISFASLWLVGGGLESAASFLLVFGTFAYLTRWAGGWLVDRIGSYALLLPGSAASLIGLTLFASAHGHAAFVPAAGVLVGSGSGLLMTSSQLDMLARGGPHNLAVSTTAWNIAIDCGVGLGGVLLGVVAAVSGYETAFWILPCVMAVAVALMLIEPRTRTRVASAEAREV